MNKKIDIWKQLVDDECFVYRRLLFIPHVMDMYEVEIKRIKEYVLDGKI